jgi:hypothetical protein
MADSIYLDFLQGIQAQSGEWYKKLQVLGTGGNAVTFLVLATSGSHQGVLFAMKVFRRLSMVERRSRFLAEIEF